MSAPCREPFRDSQSTWCKSQSQGKGFSPPFHSHFASTLLASFLLLEHTRHPIWCPTPRCPWGSLPLLSARGLPQPPWVKARPPCCLTPLGFVSLPHLPSPTPAIHACCVMLLVIIFFPHQNESSRRVGIYICFSHSLIINT